VLLTGLTVTGVLATGAFAVQMWAQRVVPAHQVALIFALEPACAAWLSSLFLGEQLDSLGWIGSGCILVATLLGTLWGHGSDAMREAAPGTPPK
jgi:drug/metabolite transporter (DMT)-like permease